MHTPDPTVVRQWKVLRILSSRHYGVTVREMSEELGVSTKTVRRDLVDLRSVGFAIEEEVVEFGKKRFSIKKHVDEAFTFTYDEALALFLSRRFFAPLEGTYFWESAERAFRKIRACLAPLPLTYIQAMNHRIVDTAVSSSKYSDKREMIDDLMRAVEDSNQTVIVYRSQKATEPVDYEVYPYGLVSHRQSLYLIAYSIRHESVRHFKIDRLHEAEVHNLRFQRPDDFDLRKHLAGSFGVFGGDGDIAVKIKFLPRVARYVTEGNWHESQVLDTQRDGSVIAEFQLSATEEIKNWVLSFGANAVVLEPKQLRNEIATEIRQMAENYRIPKKRTT